jgi:hypothetical protein
MLGYTRFGYNLNLCLLASWINRYHLNSAIWRKSVDHKYNNNPNIFCCPIIGASPFWKGVLWATKAAQMGGCWNGKLGFLGKLEMDKPLGFGRIVGLVLVAWQSNIETWFLIGKLPLLLKFGMGRSGYSPLGEVCHSCTNELLARLNFYCWIYRIFWWLWCYHLDFWFPQGSIVSKLCIKQLVLEAFGGYILGGSP